MARRQTTRGIQLRTMVWLTTEHGTFRGLSPQTIVRTQYGQTARIDARTKTIVRPEGRGRNRHLVTVATITKYRERRY